MKIIAVNTASCDVEYIAYISHSELEKVAGKYYGKMERLKVGDVHDIAAGYNFRNDIQEACRKMVDATATFEHNKDTLNRFAQTIVGMDVQTKNEDKQ